MILLAFALIIALIWRPTTIDLLDGRHKDGEPRYREVPAPVSHVVTWAIVAGLLAGGVFALALADRL